MARELVNELTWSVSRDRLFRQCRRAYYYNYYGSWGGWDAAAADERTRRIYILKNIQSLNMWAGGIVHDTIAEALRRFAAKTEPVTVEALRQAARSKLRRGWLEAVNREWLVSPKKTNLFELYYGNGATVPEELTEDVKTRVYGCLEALATSPLLAEIIAAGYMNWKPVDTLDAFVLDDGLKVWCAIDFAFFDEAGMLRILDWKTGSEQPEELKVQLACYAMFAMRKWKAPLQRLRLAGVFLGDTARVSEYPLSTELLADTENIIGESIGKMRLPLSEPEKNMAREEDFPTCDVPRICGRCNFREVCPAITGSKPKTEAAPASAHEE